MKGRIPKERKNKTSWNSYQCWESPLFIQTACFYCLFYFYCLSFFAVHNHIHCYFSDLDHRLSILIWLAILISFIVCITVPRLSGIRTLAGAVILRMIFTLGIKPTLTILGLLNVSFKGGTFFSFFSCITIDRESLYCKAFNIFRLLSENS